MIIETKYKRTTVYGVEVWVTDSAEAKSPVIAEKAIDAAFGKFAMDADCSVSVGGMNFFWESKEDFSKDIVTFNLKGKKQKISRNKSINAAKKYSAAMLKEHGYDRVYE